MYKQLMDACRNCKRKVSYHVPWSCVQELVPPKRRVLRCGGLGDETGFNPREQQQPQQQQEQQGGMTKKTNRGGSRKSSRHGSSKQEQQQEEHKRERSVVASFFL